MFAADFSFEDVRYTCAFDLESYSDCFIVIVHLADKNLRTLTRINPFSIKYSVDILSYNWAINNRDTQREQILKSSIADAIKTELGK